MKVQGLKPVAPPRTICAYFKREYFKHKSKFTIKKKTIWDATEMWSKLSCEERDKFRIRFEESKCRHEQEYARYLGKLEPYLKKKNENNLEDIELGPSAVLENSVAENREVHQHSNVESECVVDESVECAGPVVPASNEQVVEMEGDFTQSETVDKPVPPPKDAKQLFMMTHEEMMHRSRCEDIWRILPRAQKHRYWTAVKLLKNKFLERYKMYLISLSSFQLALHLKEKNLLFNVQEC